MKNLSFEIAIQAPRTVAWSTMLGESTYRQWTAAFCEGSHYRGSWDQGATIHFLSPTGDGMIAVIAKNEPLEFISIRHVGMIENGVEDTTSEKVRSWTPAYENYYFSDLADGCLVRVTLDTAPDYEQYMLDTYPKALAILKQLCEQRHERDA